MYCANVTSTLCCCEYSDLWVLLRPTNGSDPMAQAWIQRLMYGGRRGEAEGYALPHTCAHTCTRAHIRLRNTVRASPCIQTVGQALPQENCLFLLFIFRFPFYLSLFSCGSWAEGQEVMVSG